MGSRYCCGICEQKKLARLLAGMYWRWSRSGARQRKRNTFSRRVRDMVKLKVGFWHRVRSGRRFGFRISESEG
ncbi:hypothetical protein BDZ91DRAFT_737965, partial [Kalaharituber pfeilii]